MSNENSRMNSSLVEQYQMIYKKDPSSKVFAPLAEAYREMGMLDEAEKVARNGIQRHPDYASGFVALGKILQSKKSLSEAKAAFKKATDLSPENLLSYQMIGQISLELREPKEALKAYKMVLFLNPQNEKAKKAVEKLESLTADEYEEELFQMTPLREEIRIEKPTPAPQKTRQTEPDEMLAETPHSSERELERLLSLCDAYLVRANTDKARQFLEQARKEYPNHPQVLKKWQMLFSDEDDAEPISPIMSREKRAQEAKLKTLEGLLHRINDYRHLERR